MPFDPAKPWRFSATQFDTFLDCPRKWAWKYIAGKRTPPNKSAALGSLVHKLLENYLRTGETLPLSSVDPKTREAAEIAAAGIHHLPAPKTPGMVVEGGDTDDEAKGFQFEIAPGVIVRGAKDIRFANGPVEVWDHKTTVDFKWAKTAEQLRKNVQAVLYAYEEMEVRAADHVDLNWVYYRTRDGRASKKVHLRMVKEQVLPPIRALGVVGRLLLLSLKEQRDPLSFPAETTHCGAYGGCPYKADCSGHFTSEELRRGMMSNNTETEDLLSRLETRKDQMEGKPTAAPSVKDDDLDSLLARMDAPATPPQAVNPPEFQPPPASVEAREEAKTEEPKKQKGPGRPRGSKNKPAEEQAPIDAEAAEKARQERYEAAVAKVEAAKQPEAPPATVKAKFSLWVDAMPLGADVTMAEEIFQEVKARILKEHDKADYRYFEYGKGAGVFQETLQKLVDEGAVTGRVVLNSRTPEGQLAMAVLMPAAQFPVTRGF